jgi:hypothetical protein
MPFEAFSTTVLPTTLALCEAGVVQPDALPTRFRLPDLAGK